MKKFVLPLFLILSFTSLAFSEEPQPEPKSVEVALPSDSNPAPQPVAPSEAQAPSQLPPLPVVPAPAVNPAPPVPEQMPHPSIGTSASAVSETSALSPSGAASLDEAKQFLAAGDLKAAKRVLEPELVSLTGADRDKALDILAEANFKLLFEGGEFAGTTDHIVKPGDSLYVIAKKYKTTPEMIMRLNKMKNTVIRPDQKLKVLTVPFSIKVSKSKNRLELYLGNDIIRTYQVATGTNNSSPVGTFTITTKLENPTWYKTGAVVPPGNKENILGTRWLGFSLAGFGIHGTTQPEAIGTQATAGCVRMRNAEVEELYGLVPPGTSVTIEN